MQIYMYSIHKENITCYLYLDLHVEQDSLWSLCQGKRL